MSDNICISVSDHRGTSHYLISRLKKRYFALAGLSLFAGLGIGGYSVYSLYQDNQLSLQQMSTLSESLTEENATNQALLEKLSEKKAELSMLSERIDDVEAVLGVAGVEGGAATLEKRVNSAAVSSAVRGTLFSLIPNGSPTPGTRMSSQYGVRIHPVTGKRKRHLGLDFAANIGTEIFSPADGVVEVTRPSNKGSGNFLKLNHSFGFATSYSHMKKFNVKSGQFVRKGDLLGWTGNTGLSTGPHLHYELRFLGRALNPRSFVEWTPDNFDSLFEKEKTVQWTSLLDMVGRVVTMQVKLTQAVQVEALDAIESAEPKRDPIQTAKSGGSGLKALPMVATSRL